MFDALILLAMTGTMQVTPPVGSPPIRLCIFDELAANKAIANLAPAALDAAQRLRTRRVAKAVTLERCAALLRATPPSVPPSAVVYDLGPAVDRLRAANDPGVKPAFNDKTLPTVPGFCSVSGRDRPTDAASAAAFDRTLNEVFKAHGCRVVIDNAYVVVANDASDIGKETGDRMVATSFNCPHGTLLQEVYRCVDVGRPWTALVEHPNGQIPIFVFRASAGQRLRIELKRPAVPNDFATGLSKYDGTCSPSIVTVEYLSSRRRVAPIEGATLRTDIPRPGQFISESKDIVVPFTTWLTAETFCYAAGTNPPATMTFTVTPK